jgi:hypothetical protein
MARISSQGARIYVESVAGTPQDISALTKAKPAVATVTSASGIQPGDVVVLELTGFASVDGRAFVAGNVNHTANTVELLGSDTTGEAGVLDGDATLREPTMIEACVATINLDAPASPTVDVTTLCDDSRRTVGALPAAATFTANGFYDINDVAQDRIIDLHDSGDITTFKAVLRDASVVAWRSTVNQQSLALGVDQPVQLNFGGQLDGMWRRGKPGTLTP